MKTRPERIYLLFITIVYFLIGIGAISHAMNNFNIPILQPLFSALLLFGFFAVLFPFVIVLPRHLLLSGVSLFNGSPPSSELLLSLGIVAIVLSIAAFYALLRVDSSPRLIFIWYGVLSLCGTTTLYNFILQHSSGLYFSLGSLVPVVIMFFAVKSMHHRLTEPIS